MLGIWKIVGCRPAGNIAASSISAAVDLGRQGEGAVVALAPLQCTGERVDDRLDPALSGLRVESPGRKQVPSWLPLARAGSNQVELDYPLGELRLGKAALDPLDRVLVGVQEKPAVSRADNVQELRDRELGLPPPAPPSGVCEERVLEAQANPAFPALVLHASEREEVTLARERREALRRGVDSRAEPHDVRRGAVDRRRLQQPGHLTCAHIIAAERAMQAGPHPAIEPGAQTWKV